MEPTAPPDYANAASASHPDDSKPPSYFDVVNQLKSIKTESKNPADFASKTCAILCGSIIFSIFLVISSAMPIAQLVIGAIYKDQCTIEQRIPIWLIVMGSCGLAAVLLKIFGNVFELINKRKDSEAKQPFLINMLSTCLGLFLLIWFIIGNVWVYSNYNKVQYDNSLLDNYCQKTVYLFAFWSITISWIFLALCYVCLCGLLCCTMGIASCAACCSICNEK